MKTILKKNFVCIFVIFQEAVQVGTQYIILTCNSYTHSMENEHAIFIANMLFVYLLILLWFIQSEYDFWKNIFVYLKANLKWDLIKSPKKRTRIVNIFSKRFRLITTVLVYQQNKKINIFYLWKIYRSFKEKIKGNSALFLTKHFTFVLKKSIFIL